MILELLKVIRGLNTHSTRINLYEHALRTMSRVSEQTNKDEVIVAALLHKAKPLLRSDKWDKCMTIMTTKHRIAQHGPYFAKTVVAFIDQIAPPSDSANTYDFFRKTFQNCNKDAEMILLTSILVEVEMSKSYKISASYNGLLDELISLGQLDADDELIREIRSSLLTQ